MESRKRAILGSDTLDFPSIAAGATEELTMVVLGVEAGDAVAFGPPTTVDAELIVTGYCRGTDLVTIRIHNPTVAAIDPASETWKVAVFK